MKILNITLSLVAALGLVLLLSVLAAAQTITVSDDGKYFGASDGKTTEIWDVARGTMTARVDGWFAAFSAGGAHFATETGNAEKSITKVWNSGNSDPVGGFEGWLVDLSKDGKWLVTDHPQAGVRLWDTTTGAVVRTLVAGPLVATAGAVSPDFSWLSIHRLGAAEVEIVNIADAKVAHTVSLGKHPDIENLDDITDGIDISSDGKLLAYTYGNQWDTHRILVADATTGKQVANFRATMGASPGIQFDPSGTMLISDGNTVDLWNARSGKRVRSFNISPILYRVVEWGTSSEMSKDGKLLAVTGPEGRTMMFNFATGRELRWFRRLHPEVYQFTPNGDSLIILDRNGVVNQRNAASGKLIRRLANTGIKS